MIYRCTFHFTDSNLKDKPPLHLFLEGEREYVKQSTLELFEKYLSETSFSNANFIQEIFESSEEEAKLFYFAGPNLGVMQ